MKQLLVCSIILICRICCYSQNVLLDGIEQSGKVYMDGKKISAAFGRETSECSFEYDCYFMDVDDEFYDDAKWNWKEIISVVIVEDLALLMKASDKVIYHDYDEGEEIVNESFVWLYFTTAEMAKSAQEWIMERIVLCGGTATK